MSDLVTNYNKKTYKGPYNWLYNELQQMYPDWNEEQLKRAAYSDYYAKEDAKSEAEKMQNAYAKQGLIQTGASTLGSILTAALLGYFK